MSPYDLSPMALLPYFSTMLQVHANIRKRYVDAGHFQRLQFNLA
jgi:hypothetical protein